MGGRGRGHGGPGLEDRLGDVHVAVRGGVAVCMNTCTYEYMYVYVYVYVYEYIHIYSVYQYTHVQFTLFPFV